MFYNFGIRFRNCKYAIDNVGHEVDIIAQVFGLYPGILFLMLIVRYLVDDHAGLLLAW